MVSVRRLWNPKPKQTTTAASRSLQTALSEHLERSQILLTQLEHLTAEQADAKAEKDRARILLNHNHALREAALQSHEYGPAVVLDALQTTLRTVADAPQPMSKTEANLLRDQVQESGLLFKVRVIRQQLSPAKRKESRNEHELQGPL